MPGLYLWPEPAWIVAQICPCLDTAPHVHSIAASTLPSFGKSRLYLLSHQSAVSHSFTSARRQHEESRRLSPSRAPGDTRSPISISNSDRFVVALVKARLDQGTPVGLAGFDTPSQSFKSAREIPVVLKTHRMLFFSPSFLFFFPFRRLQKPPTLLFSFPFLLSPLSLPTVVVTSSADSRNDPMGWPCKIITLAVNFEPGPANTVGIATPIL